MKKKILCLLFCAAIGSAVFTSCGKDSDNTQESVTESQGTFVDTTETTEVILPKDTEGLTETTQEENIQVEDNQSQGMDEPQTENSQQQNSQLENGVSQNTQTEESQGAVYTYEEMSATMYAKSSVNIRNLPSVEGKQLGKLGKYDVANVTGKCKETGWYRISYNNGTAYVSGDYLLTEAEKNALEEKEREAAEQKAREEAEKKAQEEAQKQEQANNDNQIQDTIGDDSSNNSSENKPSNENQNKQPEWLMMESASKVLSADQKAHIDGMVKQWMNDSSYTNGQLDEDICYYLESLGYVIGEDVTRTGMDKNAGIIWSAEQLGDLPWHIQNVYDSADVYEFQAFYTEWKYDGEDRLIVYETYVTVM